MTIMSTCVYGGCNSTAAVHACVTWTYTYTHAYVQMNMHVYIYTCIRECMHAYTCAGVHAYIQTYIHTNTHIYSHTYKNLKSRETRGNFICTQLLQKIHSKITATRREMRRYTSTTLSPSPTPPPCSSFSSPNCSSASSKL